MSTFLKKQEHASANIRKDHQTQDGIGFDDMSGLKMST